MNKVKIAYCALLLMVHGFLVGQTPQTSVTVEVPQFVKAGEVIQIVGHLSPAPNFEGGGVQWTLRGPGDFTVQSGAEATETFTITYKLPEAARPGRWTLEKLSFWDGVSSTPLKFEPKSFTVIGKEGLIYPQSAELSILPTQIQLLRSEALNIQTEIQNLKVSIKSSPSRALAQLLEHRIREQLDQISKTEDAYQKLGSSSQTASASIFFSDIRTSYLDAIRAINPKGAVKPVSYSERTDKMGDESFLIAQSTLRAYEHNELAYETAAGKESLNFDLDVQSTPAGATISYGLRGDDKFRTAQDQTNTSIKSLTLAIWIVRVSAPGYISQEKEHNAINETYHVLHFNLESDSRAK